MLLFSQIRDAFIQQLTQGYSHYDRQLRNDLLVLSSLVASNAHSAPFIETGFAKQLVLFATFQEGTLDICIFFFLWQEKNSFLLKDNRYVLDHLH